MRVQPPVRVSRSYTQRLAGSADEVFPLLCPVREVEWVPGWEPLGVWSASGVAERDCVFTTADGAGEATWVVLEHDPSRHAVEMVKTIPGHTVTRVRIELRDAAGRPHACEAYVTYTWTALSEGGEAFVRSRTEEAWTTFMQGWEEALNAYLTSRRPRA
jgi:hypothetical protein